MVLVWAAHAGPRVGFGSRYARCSAKKSSKSNSDVGISRNTSSSSPAIM